MESFLTKLKDVTTFIFDVDGVLTDGSVYVTDEGLQLRKFNIKDGYALQLAVKRGYHVCAISGASTEAIRKRLNHLGIKDVFLGTVNKVATFYTYIAERHIDATNVVYMGDDVPDLHLLRLVGLPVCPADAVEDIKTVCTYVSPLSGGLGCARDIIEKVMRVQGTWGEELSVASL